jgi:chloramphenicol 3-O phosphotransferase
MSPLVIILNGASSAGKTSTADALACLIKPSLSYISLDDVLIKTNTGNKIAVWLQHLTGTRKNTVFRLLNEEIRQAAMSEGTTIVDVCYMLPGSMIELARMINTNNVYLIGIKPPLSVSEQWERQRGDRRIGQARKHYYSAHQHNIYDLVIDTSGTTPLNAANEILSYIQSNSPTAFIKLRDQLSVDS